MEHDTVATVIGESILITGELAGNEDMTILGRVEGSIRSEKTLFVAADGIVKADIAAENAVISGIVIGNVTARESVQITETGRLVGDLSAPRVVIVAGARVRGQVDMGARGGQSLGRDTSARQQPASLTAANKQRITALTRAPSGRFERLSVPARRPMPKATAAAHDSHPQRDVSGGRESDSLAKSTQAAHAARQHTSSGGRISDAHKHHTATAKKASQGSRRRHGQRRRD